MGRRDGTVIGKVAMGVGPVSIIVWVAANQRQVG
jgi:hypothetical protein